MEPTKQPNLWAAEWSSFAAATVFITLRLMSRKLREVGLWWDDYFAIACYFSAIAWSVVIMLWVSQGLGLHVDDISRDVTKTNSIMLHYLFTIEHIYTFNVSFAKASLLFFYWRMFRVANINIAIYTLLTATALWAISRFIFTDIQCIPTQAFWELSIRPNATCFIKTNKYIFGSVLSHIILDLFIIILPIMQIKKLQLPWLQKVGILLMFLVDPKSEDLSWAVADTITWGTVEINLLTLSTCLPTIRPACLYLGSRLGLNTANSLSANDFGQSHSRPNHSKSIRLSERPKDENSSTYELAVRMEHNGDSISETESHSQSGKYKGNITAVTHTTGSNDHDDYPSRSEYPRGILVKNETIVTYRG
ncbi:L-fucose permease [Fusarium pseudoanthophilum]|uniref:L-fucose permease n=1 Tax=Fusarium pseudoanthophilum TaxID=48495 RepID=A0A8H5NQD0_9HYPO|nr:L-fucose permease [Fusarium pseudoanthophilum]